MSRKKVLVVEDDADVRLGYQILLRAHDYETLFAADAAAAIREARTRMPDLILLDLGLPAGDGFLVLDRLQAMLQLATIPVIVVSARDSHANKARAMAAGARAYVQKPWEDVELLRTIADLVGRDPPSSPPG